MPYLRNERERKYGKALKLHLLEAAAYQCSYCGRALDAAMATIDHIDPGGPDSVSNYAICCNPCNTSKGDKSLEQFRLFFEARRIFETLPQLNWTTSQIIWLTSQDWFPFRTGRHVFHFEKIRN